VKDTDMTKNTNDTADNRAVATSNAAINATIKSLRSATTKVRELIQRGIEQCIEHGSKYGDVTGAGRLVDALPDELRRVEVVRHFGEYSPIRITGQGRGKPVKASLRKPDAEGYNDWNLEGVKAHPWYERKTLQDAADREMQAFDETQSRDRIVTLANFIENKAGTKNRVKLDDDGNPMKDDNGEYVRVNAVEDEDREKLRAEAMMLRIIAKDPEKAAKLLGLPNNLVKALSDVPEAAVDTDTDAEQPPVPRTGTEG
jgi:hypothetical protein